MLIFSRCTVMFVVLTLVAVTGEGLIPSVMAEDIDPQIEQCPECQAALDASGWCKKCNVGVSKGVKTKCPNCFVAIQSNGWCPDCKVGYVDGKKTTCKTCFAAMSSEIGSWCPDCKVGYAKGIKTQCPSCFSAIQKNGWCDDCNVGYSSGKKTSCKSCYAAMGAESGGWCDECKIGYAKGIKTTCRSCFAAIQKDGWCEGCKVGYVAGQKTSCKICFAAMSNPNGAWCDDCQIGYGSGLKTKCKQCFAAIKANGTCQDCGIRFQDGRSFKQFSLHVHGINADADVKVIQLLLAKQVGVGSVKVDRNTGKVSFEMETANGTKIAVVIDALKSVGYLAHEGDH